MADKFDEIKKIRDGISKNNEMDEGESSFDNEETKEDEIIENIKDTEKDNKPKKSKWKINIKPIKDIFLNNIKNKKLQYFVMIILGLFLFSLFRNYWFNEKYSIYSKGSNIYRLNKFNGQLTLIDDTRLIPIDEPKKLDELGLNKVKIWDKINISSLEGIDVNLMTNWRDGRLYYQFRVSPYSKKLKNIREGDLYSNMYKSFSIKLQDENGFDLLTVPILISDMVGGTDDNNKIYVLSRNNNIECSYEKFKAIKNWDIEWNL